MEKGILKSNATEIKYSFLQDRNKDWKQFWYTIIPEKPEPIAEQIKTIELAEAELYKQFSIKTETAASKRFFSSDLISHRGEIMKYKERLKTDFFISITEQPPLSQVKVSLLGMCLSNIKSKSRDKDVISIDMKSGFKHIFDEHLMDREADEHSASEEQTRKIFNILENKLAKFNTSIEESCLRTWIYAPHVDADYPGIVKARKEIFDSMNMTEDTHYIASTGIQGGGGSRFARVFMDAYAILGLERDKIRYIQAPDHLSPTHVYGVTFERATAIKMGKTDFLFISGTASIDKEGNIMYPGDVVKQTDRTLENISALLDSAHFSKEDLASFIVYLRDPTDYNFIKSQIDQFTDNLPSIYVQAPVCRPGWLIEIEATAAKAMD